MDRISIQLPADVLQLLKRKAHLKKISVSAMTKEFIQAGLLTSSKKDKEDGFISHSKLERYLLKAVIEILYLVQQQLPEAKQSLISQANQLAKDIIKQLIEENPGE